MLKLQVRPLNNREKLHQHQPCVRISTESNQIVVGKDKVFAFDYVIPPKATQSELYDHCVKGLVHSLFEGYNATVFAYGQTVCFLNQLVKYTIHKIIEITIRALVKHLQSVEIN